jgi:hypothetical protein
MDAVFVDDRRMLIAKSSSVQPFVPLMVLNYRNGETVPMGIKGKAALRLYAGESGALYSVVADNDESGTVTRLVKIDTENPIQSVSLVEYRADDVQTSVAETGKYLATTLGGDGISVMKQSQFYRFERPSSLPKRLLAAGQSLLSLCDDGSLVWYNVETGKATAILKFSDETWELSRGAENISGRIKRKAF